MEVSICFATMSGLLASLWNRVFGSLPGYVDYHHYVVGEAHNVARQNKPFSDRLLVAAYEDIYVNVQGCGLWGRRDDVPARLLAEHRNVFPFYLAAKVRRAQQ